MFGDWRLTFERDENGHNWVCVTSDFSGCVYRLHPDHLDRAWAMVAWRNAAAAHARALGAAA